jgi:hypothetical protein
MHRIPAPSRLAAAIVLALPLLAGATDAPRALRIDAAPLPRCLEQIAAATGARFIVSPALARSAPACRAVDGATSAAMALDAALPERDVAWRLREDGVFLVAASAPVAAGTLETLAVEDGALEGGDATRAAPPSFRPAFADLAGETTYVRDELAAKPLQRFNQLGRLAPNVYSSGESLSIRGVPRDNDYFTGNGVFLDGIDVGSLLLDHNLLVVDDLEALRYQRSGTGFALGGGLAGGAIRIDTPLPSPAFGLRATLGGGERSAAQAGLAANGPLLPDGSLSARLSLSAREEPRFMRSAVVPSIDGDTDRRDNAQLRLRWEPGALPGFTLDLAGFHVEGDAPDRTVARPGTGVPFDIYDRISFDRAAIDYDLRGTGRGLRAGYEGAGGLRLEAWGSDLRASREGVALVQPTSITLRGDDEERARGGVGVALPFGDGWRLFGGLERQRVERTEAFVQRPGPTPSSGVPRLELQQNILDLDNTALLAELSLARGPWRASAGVRAIDETVDFRFRRRIEPQSGPVDDRITQSTRSEYGRGLPAAAVEYALSPLQSIGGGWSRAYRSGGFSQFVVIGDYPPEMLDTGEAWWRARSADDRYGLRATLFRTDWTDRTSIDGTIGTEIIEPFETRIDGAELEFDWRATESLSLRGGLGWLDARHTSGRYRRAFNEFDLEGRRANDAPRHTVVLGALWRGNGGWTAALDAYRAGRAESSTFVIEAVREQVPLPRDAYTVVDARIGWQGEHVGVALTASNLFDAEYIDRFVARRAFSRILGEPRQVDLAVTWRW